MTKDEIKALIAGITKENTTESLHAEVLNALVDMIPQPIEITNDMLNVPLSEEQILALQKAPYLEFYGSVYPISGFLTSGVNTALREYTDADFIYPNYWGYIIADNDDTIYSAGALIIAEGGGIKSLKFVEV